MIRALVFDFDGLILDTEMPVFVAWQEVYRAYGCTLTLAAWSACLGSGDPAAFDPYLHLEAQLGRPVDRAAVDRRQHPREMELLAAQTVLPGVEAYLRDARRLGLGLAVASSSPHSWVDSHLDRLGLLRWFDVVKCGEDVAVTKPAPDLYLAAVAALGVLPAEAIALEDSPNGILAARRAGLFCVAVPNLLTRQLDTSYADLRLDSLADLPLEALLARVEQSRPIRESIP